MRSALEAAMASVITSRSACDSYADDPQTYAESFDLDAAEVESLVAMRGDLVSLMPSFVTKRMRTIRWNAARTLTLLGPTGDALLEEFVDTRPASEEFREESEVFTDFVVHRTEEMASTTPNGRIIAEVARFDRLRSAAFWNATGPLRRGPSTSSRWQPGDQFDADRLIRLPVSARHGHFEWDLRQARRYTGDTIGALRRDPCELLFFHNGQADGIRVLRLGEHEAAAVVQLSDHGKAMTARAACGAGAGDAQPRRVLGKLLWQGALEWA